MRRPGLTTLTLLLLLPPAAARAALDLASLDLVVKTEGTSGIDTVFQVTLTVTGTELKTASLTPTGGSAISLPCAAAATSCSVTQSPTTQAALDALLPTTAREYTIALTGTTGTPTPTVTGKFSFGRPAVSSPAISAPEAESTVLPGPLQVKFLACAPSTCNAATEGVLKKGGVTIETKLDLPASSTSWEPAIALVQESDFSAQITHAAVASTNATADGVGAGAADDAYLLASRVTHSDQVFFATGFPPPVGDFCIVVNQDAADGLDSTGCTIIHEPPAGILDTRGSFSTSAAGIAIEYDLLLAASGRLSGTAAADLDGDESPDAYADLVGRLKGNGGRLVQKLRLRFIEPDAEARLRLAIREKADLATLGTSGLPLDWLVVQTLRGRLGGARLSERTTAVRTLPPPPTSGWTRCDGGTSLTGWKLRFTLTGENGPISGNLELASCASIALTGTQRFHTLSNRSTLTLDSGSAERGVRMRLKRLEIDATQPPEDRITAGVVRFRAFGQRSSLLVP